MRNDTKIIFNNMIHGTLSNGHLSFSADQPATIGDIEDSVSFKGFINNLKQTILQYNITSIGFSMNDLWRAQISSLLNVIEALQGTTVTSLNLSNNMLNRLGENLTNFAESLQKTEVAFLNIGGNNLDKLSEQDLCKFATALFTSQIIVTAGAKELSSLLCKQLEIFKNNPIYFDHKFLLISENQLEQVVHELEEKNTPSANMTAALLLSGLIPTAQDNKILSEISDEAQKKYDEKRLHDAIALIKKAGQDPNWHDAALHYLLQIRAMHSQAYESITDRLSCYPLQSSTSEQFNKRTEVTAKIPKFLFWDNYPTGRPTQPITITLPDGVSLDDLLNTNSDSPKQN